MTSFIRTVIGDIPSEQLGYCQCHEHLLIARGQSALVDPSLCLDDEGKSALELFNYKAAGGEALIDAQPVGCGRMANGLARLSNATGVKIIASTGFHKLAFYPANAFVYTETEDKLTELFTNEIAIGTYSDHLTKRSNVQAGVIKGASDGRDIRGDSPDLALYQKLFRAAGRAAAKTGAPVLTHLEMGHAFEGPVEILLNTGVDRNQIILCHLDREIDLDTFAYYRSAGASGCWLELDTIGRFKYHDDALEARFIAKLCESGFENQILLGTDSTANRLGAYGGSFPLTYIKKSFRQTLAQYGINDRLFEKFTRINPQKALAFQK